MTQKKINFFKEIVQYAQTHYIFSHVVFDKEKGEVCFFVGSSSFFSLDWQKLEPVYKCYSEKNIRTAIENGWANMIRNQREFGVYEYTTEFRDEEEG